MRGFSGFSSCVFSSDIVVTAVRLQPLFACFVSVQSMAVMQHDVELHLCS